MVVSAHCHTFLLKVIVLKMHVLELKTNINSIFVWKGQHGKTKV